MSVTAEPATARILFVELPYTLVTEEAERIGLDHVAKISASSDTSRAADTLQVRYPHGVGDQGAPVQHQELAGEDHTLHTEAGFVEEPSVKRKKKLSKKEETAERAEKFKNAMIAWNSGLYESIRSCAMAFDVPRTSLSDMIHQGRDNWRAPGRHSTVFSEEEEMTIKNYIEMRCELGVGLTINEVEMLMLHNISAFSYSKRIFKPDTTL